MQETKLGDDDAPEMPFRMLGYEMAHHGEGRWNGVAIAEQGRHRGRRHELRRRPGPRLRPRARRSRSARTTSTRSMRRGWCPRCAAGSGSSACMRRTAASSARRSTRASCAGSSASAAGSTRRREPGEPLVIGGDYNVTPAPEDVWSEVKAHGGTHVSPPEREALARLREWGLVGRLPVAAPGAGPLLVVGLPGGDVPSQRGHADRPAVRSPSPSRSASVWAEIDREARKGPPTPSDHAPVVIDLDEPGTPFDAGWDGALERIAARTKPRR